MLHKPVCEIVTSTYSSNIKSIIRTFIIGMWLLSVSVNPGYCSLLNFEHQAQFLKDYPTIIPYAYFKLYFRQCISVLRSQIILKDDDDDDDNNANNNKNDNKNTTDYDNNSNKN